MQFNGWNGSNNWKSRKALRRFVLYDATSNCGSSNWSLNIDRNIITVTG